MPLSRPSDAVLPGQISLWAMFPRQTPSFRHWEVIEFKHIHDHVASGVSCEDLENVIGQAHIEGVAGLASCYDGELVSEIAVDSYITFRRDFLEKVRDRRNGDLLHPRLYNAKFVTYVRWRIIEALRRKRPRDVSDALTAHIHQVQGASRPDDLFETRERGRLATVAMPVLRDLAEGNPSILLWLDGQLSDDEIDGKLSDVEIADKLGIRRSAVAPRLSRFRAKARKALSSFV